MIASNFLNCSLILLPIFKPADNPPELAADSTTVSDCWTIIIQQACSRSSWSSSLYYHMLSLHLHSVLFREILVSLRAMNCCYKKTRKMVWWLELLYVSFLCHTVECVPITLQYFVISVFNNTRGGLLQGVNELRHSWVPQQTISCSTAAIKSAIRVFIKI